MRVMATYIFTDLSASSETAVKNTRRPSVLHLSLVLSPCLRLDRGTRVQPRPLLIDHSFGVLLHLAPRLERPPQRVSKHRPSQQLVLLQPRSASRTITDQQPVTGLTHTRVLLKHHLLHHLLEDLLHTKAAFSCQVEEC